MQLYAMYKQKNQTTDVLLTTPKTIGSILINQALNLYAKQVE
jgi:hypothetical protein